MTPLKEGGEMFRHGADILGYQNPTFLSRDAQDFEIGFTLEISRGRRLKIHRGFAAQTAGNDVVSKARIREEANHCSRRLVVRPRASRKRLRRASGIG